MRAEAPVSGQSRPPNTPAAGQAGAALRPTARVRPTVSVVLTPGAGKFDPSDPYVRRFWVAALGPGAVAELLRLVRAARRGEEVRLPRHLPLLLRSGLTKIDNGAIVVVDSLPVVPAELRWRFPPAVAAEHSRWVSGINA